MKPATILFTLNSLPGLAHASQMSGDAVALVPPWVAYLCLAIFAVAILLVSLEEFLQLHKSKPMLLGAGAIWGLIGWSAQGAGQARLAEVAVRHSLLQFSELMLFLLVVMTYINAMSERQVFSALRSWVAGRRIGYRQLFWASGLLTFGLSPFLDNLSTVLLMGAVVMSIGWENRRFLQLACLNLVVAANAGGAFSPFGDITTLMVWQQDILSSNGRVGFNVFFNLFVPALASYLIPAICLHCVLPRGEIGWQPPSSTSLRRGAKSIIGLFALTTATAVIMQSLLHLPAVIGMLTGLSYLQFFGYYLKRTHPALRGRVARASQASAHITVEGRHPFDIFLRVARAEWDTLLFLCGVLLAVGGLGYVGWLSLASQLLYTQWGPTTANISVGLASAVLDNIPTMSAVLTMGPQMSQGQWLLATLTTGLGGSLLSIGSAAGVAMMGQSRGAYTFFSHLQWTPLIALGYGAGIATHLWLNAHLF